MPLFDLVVEITVNATSPKDAADVVAHKLYVERRPFKAVVYRHEDGPDARPAGVTVMPPGTILSSIGEPLGRGNQG